MKYTLKPEELHRIKKLVNRGTFSQKVRWGNNNKQHAINGLAAEYAFCKLFNTVFDWKQTNHDEGDTIYKGRTVDVKQTALNHGGLIVCPYKIDMPATLYALMSGVAPGPFVFRGFAKKRNIFRPENLKNFGYGERFFLSQKELKSEV